MHIGWFEEARLLVLAYNVSSRLQRWIQPVGNAFSPNSAFLLAESDM